MYEYCLPVLKKLFLSDAMTVELARMDAEFQDASATTITARDTQGGTYTLDWSGGDRLKPFVVVDTRQPPTKGVEGPFPRGYVYHLGSKYPDKQNEDQLVWGEHSFALTAYVDGFRAEDAELSAGRFMAACKRVLEANQYLFGALPRAGGSSSLAKSPQIAPGHKALTAQMYHMIFTIGIRELRKG